MSIDPKPAGESAGPEETSGTTNETAPQGQDNVAQPSEEQNPVGEGTGGEVSEGGGTDAVQDSPESPGVEQIDLKALLAEVKALKENPQAAQPQAPREPTEEEWAGYEQQRGIPRGGQQWVVQSMMQLRNSIMSELGSRLGRFEKEASMAEMSAKTGFQDIRKYKDGIEEFLKEFDTSNHANPKLLELAYHYAKGKASPGAVRNAQNSAELNRKIAGKARMASPTGAQNRGTSVALTTMQKQAAQNFGMSEDEYKKVLAKRGKPVAA